MKTWEVSDDKGKVVLEIGDTKGGMTLLRIDAELRMSIDDARDLGEELIRVAELLEERKGVMKATV